MHGNDDGWGSAGVLVPLVVSGLLVPAYVAWARRHTYAVLPLRLFASRGFSVANVIGLTFTIGMFGTVFLLSQYLQVVQGYSPLEAGLRTLPWTAAPMVVAPIAGAIAGRTGLRKLLLVGLSLQTASLVWFAWLTEHGSAYGSFVVPLAMAGIGMGLTFAPSATAVLEGLPDGDFATASSANSTVREFGVALGIALLVAVFLGNGGEISPVGYDGAIGPALLTGAARGGHRRGRRPLRSGQGPRPGLTGRDPARSTRVRRPPRRTRVPSPCVPLSREQERWVDLAAHGRVVAMARPDHSIPVRNGLTGLYRSVSAAVRWSASRPGRAGGCPRLAVVRRPLRRTPARRLAAVAERRDHRDQRGHLLGRGVALDDAQEPGAAPGVAHSGMFPCFLAGSVSRFDRSSRSARTTSTRVSCGLITAST